MAVDEPLRAARSESLDRSTGPTAGRLLSQARESSGLAIEQIAAELRIEPKHLLALEEDRFEAIGAPVFAKGYLKQYGQRLGLDCPALLTAYEAQTGGREVTILPTRTIRLRDERQIGLWLGAAGALVLLGGVLAFWLLGLRPADVGPNGAGTSTSPATSLDLAPAVDPEAQTDEPPVMRALELEGQPDAAVSAESSRDAAADAGPAPADAASALAEPPASDALLPDRPASTAPATQLDPVPGSLRFELRFVEDCWVEVSDAVGARSYYGLGQAGTQASFSARPPVEVLFGNADAVAILVDGVPLTIPPRSRQGNLARFTVNASE